MFWSIDNDDFRGKCHGKPYPLIEAAKEALYKSLGYKYFYVNMIIFSGGNKSSYFLQINGQGYRV